MAQLYSRDGAYPAPLPYRIRVSDGSAGYRTRTDPVQWTPQELTAWGFVAVSAPPSYSEATQSLTWTGSAFAVVSKTTAEKNAFRDARKVERKAEVMALLAQKIAAGFDYTVGDGSERNYQIDAASQANMVAVMADFNAGTANAHGGFWRTSDNVNEAMTDAECKAFLKAAKAYKMALIRQSFVHKAAIDAKTTTAQVNAYDITADW